MPAHDVRLVEAARQEQPPFHLPAAEERKDYADEPYQVDDWDYVPDKAGAWNLDDYVASTGDSGFKLAKDSDFALNCAAYAQEIRQDIERLTRNYNAPFDRITPKNVFDAQQYCYAMLAEYLATITKYGRVSATLMNVSSATNGCAVELLTDKAAYDLMPGYIKNMWHKIKSAARSGHVDVGRFVVIRIYLRNVYKDDCYANIVFGQTLLAWSDGEAKVCSVRSANEPHVLLAPMFKGMKVQVRILPRPERNGTRGLWLTTATTWRPGNNLQPPPMTSCDHKECPGFWVPKDESGRRITWSYALHARMIPGWTDVPKCGRTAIQADIPSVTRVWPLSLLTVYGLGDSVRDKHPHHGVPKNWATEDKRTMSRRT